MLTLFPRIKANPIPPPVPEADPSTESVANPIDSLTGSPTGRPSDQANDNATDDATGQATGQATDQATGQATEDSVVEAAAAAAVASEISVEPGAEPFPEVLARIPLIGEFAAAGATIAEATIAEAPASEAVVEASAEAGAEEIAEPAVSREAPPAEAEDGKHTSPTLDIGEWEASADPDSIAGPEPVVEIAPEIEAELSAEPEPAVTGDAENGSIEHEAEAAAPSTVPAAAPSAASSIVISAVPSVAGETLFEAFSSAFEASREASASSEPVALATPVAAAAEPALATTNRFDEIEVLDEVALAPGPAPVPEPADVSSVSTTTTSSSESPEPAPRPKQAQSPKGGLFVLPRVPEPEAMDDAGEVAVYASAASQSYLDAIDDTFVAHAQLLLKGRERGRALDIGTGPGQIVLKLGYQLTRWKFVGVDRSEAMIARANEGLATAPELAGRVEFLVADGTELDLPSRSFDLVYCNSVLHHLADPQSLFSEMARLVKPGGAILLRDLVRPSRIGFGHHIRKHGKHYSGEMKRLYVASVRAAYTEEELEKLVAASELRGVTIFRHRQTHIGFARYVSAPPSRPK